VVSPISRKRSRPWHLSLYGRIALGYLVLIAIELAAEGSVFLWMVARSSQSRGNGDVTRALASELSAELEENPDLNLADRVAKLRPGDYVFAIMTDGRAIGARMPSAPVVRDVINTLTDPATNRRIPESWVHSQYLAAPLVVNAKLIGVLGIVPLTTLEQFGPEIALLGLGLLLIGTLVSTVVIIGPVRTRIRDLQRTADRLGGGDLSARAMEQGTDEVAELAHAFNTMAEDLGKRAAAVEASDRARRQLIADVSHELMTPLTAVLGHLETLTMAEVRLNDVQRLRQVMITTREAGRLERLIGDLLDAARLEAGGGDLDFQRVPIRELFDQVVAHHDHDCRTRGLEIVCSVSPGAETLEADPFRLEQALENVTANAIRHSRDGGKIELRAERAGDHVVLLVADAGEGVAPEDLPLIFDRFYKAASARGIASRGTGLGLSIVKAIVKRHGGEISATSTLGVGTTIRIELPIVNGAVAAVSDLPDDDVQPRATAVAR
jgi:two-component system OmpR family sensor kinase